MIVKGQAERCTQPTPPVSNLLEQFLETAPVLLKDAGEEAPVVRMMEDEVDPGPDGLIKNFRVGRLF